MAQVKQADPVELPEELVIELESPITNLNGSEAWQEVRLREPFYHEVSEFYKDSEKTNPHDAMAGLIAKISEVNKIAITKLPIRKFREGQAYLLAFLNWFPDSPTGATK